MDWVCLFHKICGYYYYKKGVYVQVIRSTVRRCFRGRQHVPAWKCIHPKNKPTKNARNHENLTKRTEQHERAINSKKRSQAICSLEECKKGFNFCWTSKGKCRTKVGTTKDIILRGALHIRGAYFHAFQTNGQTGHTCVGSQKLRWPRALRSLNPSLTMVTSVPYSIAFKSLQKNMMTQKRRLQINSCF